MPRQTEQGRNRGRAGKRPPAPPDPEPWDEGRRGPGARPRHEAAEPEDSDDPAQATGAIAAESWGEIVEVEGDETVDGDFNGAPELAGLDETRAWEGDALEAMEGGDAAEFREGGGRTAEEVLADVVADRRQVLVERLDEARELDLGELFEAALEASDPEGGESPVIPDDDVLREQLAQIDAAIEELERRSAEDAGEVRPRRR